MTTRWADRRRASGDRGVVLVLVAMLFTTVLVVVALVIDHGGVRNTRQDNKRTADVVVAAALQNLASTGVPTPWRGVCTALSYLEANRPDLDLAVEYRNGAGGSVANPCTTLLEQACVAGDLATWARIDAADGDFVAEIRSGYRMPDPEFAEDASVYTDDDGVEAYGGCDQVAVIIRDRDAPLFGGVVGASGYDTVTRSVGRADIGDDERAAIALVLLEQEDCGSLAFAGGGGTGNVTVRGTGDRPGIITSDSSGTGDECGASGDRPVIQGTNSGMPRVRALAAPDDPNVHGMIRTYARFLGRTNDARWTPDRLASGTEVWLCDRDDGSAGPSPCDTGPSASRQITRTPADERYLDAVTQLRSDANAVFANPAGYVRYSADLGLDCTLGGSAPPLTVVAASDVPGSRLHIDCDELRVNNGKALVVESGIDHVLLRGRVTGGGTLDVRNPRRVLVQNVDGAAAPIAVGAGASVLINRNGAASCLARQAADRAATTELVVRQGRLDLAGGGSLAMCSTFVHLMGGQASGAPVDVNAATYPAPYGNLGNDGTFDVGGGANVDWVAPNTYSGPFTEGAYAFEDLALWTETQRDAQLRGGGDMTLTGIFFMPNSGPAGATGGFSVSGGGGAIINFDAQLWVRKFSHNGTASFQMRANPDDSITIPILGGTQLVR